MQSGNFKVTRPGVLVLASDALFPHFFSEESQKKLAEVTEWRRCSLPEDSSELRRELANADVLMTTWHTPFLTKEMLSRGTRVKLIAHCGGEVKSRVDEEVFEYVTVTNAADPMARGVAEMALALVLTLVRRIPDYTAAMRAGEVQTNADASQGETLFRRRIGLVGCGRIGRAFAQLIKPFNVELLVCDPYAKNVEGVGTVVDLDELVSSCSVIVLAAALTSETRHLISEQRLASMANGTFLINVARGGLIDLEALVVELRNKRITAALDVTDPLEPLPPDHELRRLSNVILTPHIAAGGLEMRREIGALAVSEVVRFASGLPPLNPVTREMLATMT
jgi:phosphoglycerate dehydrogenase-like enzyme